MRIFWIPLFQLLGFMAMPLIAQKYDPVDGGFETRERKIQAQTNPRLQQKNLEEWMAFNLGYARFPRGFHYGFRVVFLIAKKSNRIKEQRHC